MDKNWSRVNDYFQAVGELVVNAADLEHQLHEALATHLGPSKPGKMQAREMLDLFANYYAASPGGAQLSKEVANLLQSRNRILHDNIVYSYGEGYRHIDRRTNTARIMSTPKEMDTLVERVGKAAQDVHVLGRMRASALKDAPLEERRQMFRSSDGSR